MKVLVCFKATPDYEALRDSEWAAAAAGAPDTRYAQHILNCFDESALEMALRLSDGLADQGTVASLGALSIGGREAEPFLKTLQALGYEQATRVQTDTELDFAPASVAAIIAGFVDRLDGCDLLLLGSRSGPGDSATVPFLAAETLGWPCLAQVTDISPMSADRLRVACTTEEGLLRATVRLPCVLAVGNAVVSRLRVPTLKDRLARKHLSIEVLSPVDLGFGAPAGLPAEMSVLTGLEPIVRARGGVIVSGDTPREKARALFDSSLRDILEAL